MTISAHNRFLLLHLWCYITLLVLVVFSLSWIIIAAAKYMPEKTTFDTHRHTLYLRKRGESSNHINMQGLNWSRSVLGI